MAKPTTQETIPIASIHDDLVQLKDGSFALVLQTSAVNFDLLSEREQLAIIDSFAGLLNSLSFTIQIIIRSKRLDITNYLKNLAVAQTKLKNPLLFQMMEKYRTFIGNTIRENEVLDKQFYVVVLVSYLELGILKNIEKNQARSLTILIPRRDHLVRQFARIGLKADQLDTLSLIRLFYDIYNEADEPTPLTTHDIEIITQSYLKKPSKAEAKPDVKLQQPAANIPHTPAPPRAPHPVPPQTAPLQMAPQPQPRPPISNTPPPAQAAATSQPRTPANHSPFVVEELPDDYGQIR